MSDANAHRIVVIRNPEGLHARAATEVRKLALRFKAEVVLGKGDQWAAATDVIQMLTLGAQRGEEVHLKADGADADKVIGELAALFANDFQSGKPSDHSTAGEKT